MCRFFYNPSDGDERKLHAAAHKKYLGVIAFPGWKKENVVQEDVVEGVRILQVRSDLVSFVKLP